MAVQGCPSPPPVVISTRIFVSFGPLPEFSKFLEFRSRPLQSKALGATISMAVLPRPETMKIEQFLKIFENVKKSIFDGFGMGGCGGLGILPCIKIVWVKLAAGQP